MAGVKPNGQKQQPRLIGKERDAIREAKKRLTDTISDAGVRWVKQIIVAGPHCDSARAPIEERVEKRTVFFMALNWASDRCGGFQKQTNIAVDGAAEGIPPITVQIVGHVRPAE